MSKKIARVKPVVKKVQDEYLIGVPFKTDPDIESQSSDGMSTMLMYVDLHRTEDKETPVRITLSKNPLQFGNNKLRDYHFEESRPEIVEAVALAMLEAVKLARASE